MKIEQIEGQQRLGETLNRIKALSDQLDLLIVALSIRMKAHPMEVITVMLHLTSALIKASPPEWKEQNRQLVAEFNRIVDKANQ